MTVPNWVYGNTTSAEYYIKLFKFITTHNVTSCPQEKPFVLAGTTNCSTCNAPTPIFDANEAKCISSCPNGTKLNTTLHTCVPTTTQCQYPGQVYNSIDNNCICGPSAPYFTGSACVACLAPNFWNTTSNSCNSCDVASQQYYSPQANACLKCPASAPISTGLTCVNCNQSSYYDNQTKKCVSCPQNQLFNPVTQKC